MICLLLRHVEYFRMDVKKTFNVIIEILTFTYSYIGAIVGVEWKIFLNDIIRYVYC